MVEMAAMSTALCGLANKYGNGGEDLRQAHQKHMREELRRIPSQIQLAGNSDAQNQAVANVLRGVPLQRLMMTDSQDPNYLAKPLLKSMSKRLVRVFLVDPNASIPLDASMLYKSEEKLTDLTDQELFFEMPVQELLAKHNALRVTLVDKEASKRSNKDVLLEPAKIRDLTMTVLVLETW
jgi:hypothetical protein